MGLLFLGERRSHLRFLHRSKRRARKTGPAARKTGPATRKTGPAIKRWQSVSDIVFIRSVSIDQEAFQDPEDQ